MIYSHRLVSAKIKNNAVSKGCTWAYALNYCENTGLPAQCSSTRFSTAPPATWDDSDVASFFSSVPALSTVSDIVLGKGAYGERTDSVARPAYISGGGAGPSDVRSRHAVSCNTKPTTVGQILRDLFSALFRL
ncbi:MAG: hypothetical protein Q8Q09_16580 [Deltaproteobacteria bacterium]|nr:hypothetical protein [Deltaproteobacteria bacterium]